MASRKDFLKRWRLREEMKLEIKRTLINFESKEEPRLKITEKDIAIVLSEMLTYNLKHRV